MGIAKIYVVTVFVSACICLNTAAAQELQSYNISTDRTKPIVRSNLDSSSDILSAFPIDRLAQVEPNPTDSLETTPSTEQQNVDPIGEEPPEDISRLFLRESEILLKPMEVQLTVGFEYRKNDSFENLRLIRARDVSIPLSLSIGLTQRFEIFASLPLLYSQSEFIAFDDSITSDDGGYGDFSLGLSFKLRNETQSFPSITGSFSQLIPTGSEGDPNDPNSVNLTSGFSRQSVGLSMTKSVDPAVLFVNVGFSRAGAEQQNNQRVNPGDSVNYGFGAGFSINSAISVSGRLLGNFSNDTEVDGNSIVGSGGEAVSFNFNLTYGLSNRTRMESSIDFGLNDDASDVAMRFSYIYSLRKPGS